MVRQRSAKPLFPGSNPGAASTAPVTKVTGAFVLYAGTLAKYIGAQNAFIVSGVIGFLGFLLLFTRREIM